MQEIHNIIELFSTTFFIIIIIISPSFLPSFFPSFFPSFLPSFLLLLSLFLHSFLAAFFCFLYSSFSSIIFPNISPLASFIQTSFLSINSKASNGVAGWLVVNALTDAWSLAIGTWGWVPLEYFDLNVLIERAEREVTTKSIKLI